MRGKLVGSYSRATARRKTHFSPRRKDTIELQREHITSLRNDLKAADTFRQVYNFTFEYAKNEGQKSMSTLQSSPVLSLTANIVMQSSARCRK